MAGIKPFTAIRPQEEYASHVAALPYDVYSRAEAKTEAKKDSLSFINIDRPETQFGDEQDMYADEVYKKAREMLDAKVADGTFIVENERCYYVYELVMDDRSQTGIVACAFVDDYMDGVIKKHENTREDKELDRIRHVEACDGACRTGKTGKAGEKTLRFYGAGWCCAQCLAHCGFRKNTENFCGFCGGGKYLYCGWASQGSLRGEGCLKEKAGASGL